MQNRNQLLIGLIAVAMLSAMIVSASASQKSYSQRQLTVNAAAVVVEHNQDILKSLTFKGTPLYTGQ